MQRLIRRVDRAHQRTDGNHVHIRNTIADNAALQSRMNHRYRRLFAVQFPISTQISIPQCGILPVAPTRIARIGVRTPTANRRKCVQIGNGGIQLTVNGGTGRKDTGNALLIRADNAQVP